MADEDIVDEEKTEENEGIYSDEGREEMLDNDEIDSFEEGFMQGAEMDGQKAKCRKCGRILINPKSTVEREVNGKLIWFCSEKCADKYEELQG
ncbi:hypothetical protein J4434_02925 [Candidatus Woesearchaeota archaeon]|nr:hypothetical protein [Candidatus Woesearchaeota archaeon]